MGRPRNRRVRGSSFGVTHDLPNQALRLTGSHLNMFDRHSAKKKMYNFDSEILCPDLNCDYKGKPECENYGSALVMVLLVLFGILPGIVYRAFAMGTKNSCPKTSRSRSLVLLGA